MLYIFLLRLHGWRKKRGNSQKHRVLRTASKGHCPATVAGIGPGDCNNNVLTLSQQLGFHSSGSIWFSKGRPHTSAVLFPSAVLCRSEARSAPASSQRRVPISAWGLGPPGEELHLEALPPALQGPKYRVLPGRGPHRGLEPLPGRACPCFPAALALGSHRPDTN